MAKSKRSRAAAFAFGNARQSQLCPPKPCHNNSNIDLMLNQEAIDGHWTMFPLQAKSFILDTPDTGIYSLSNLVSFWSQPRNVHCTRDSSRSLCGAAWYLALMYLRTGQLKEARALTVNGAFIHQCCNSSIEDFEKALQEPPEVYGQKLPYFFRGFDSIGSPRQMESYIRHHLPEEYAKMMTSFANLSDASSMVGYIDQISDDWNGFSSKSHQPLKSNNDGETIKIILQEDSDGGKTHSFDIGSSTTLKALFNDYADLRGISLRSLRFSYLGKTLFLSNAGHKTPEQLVMKDLDVIRVHDSTADQELDSSGQTDARASRPSKKNKAKKRVNKKGKGRGKRRQQCKEPARTLEECRVEHSAQLSKIHDEARPQFKLIRQRLNNLSIERSQRKARRRPAPKQVPPPSMSKTDVRSKEGLLGGKAGRSRFVVQVGEVRNLYKTAKRSTAATASDPGPLPPLDLHGCTREEALSRLDASLESWSDEAMRGPYPFVRRAVIVCGCGSQTLSEAVEGWIGENDGVSNAPGCRSARRRSFSSRAA